MKKMLDKSISLVLPMYNEIEYLPKAIDAAKSILGELTTDYEIIIVDDASTDGSGKLADNLSKSWNRIKVIHHDKNRKLGGALKTGFSCATKEVIIYTDIDLPFDLSRLKEIMPLISVSDVVIGYRKGKRESVVRVFYSWIYNNLINFIFRLNIKDVNFALKIFKREILNNMQLKSEGSFINAEFLAKAKKLGVSIKETSVEYQFRTYGISRLSTPLVICKILYEMIKFYPEITLFSKKKSMYDKIKKIYNKADFWTRIYIFGRFKTCPFDKIEKFIPKKGNIVDLGCGTALLLNFLTLEQGERSLFGFDIDKRKISVAMESVKGRHGISIEEKDINSDSLALPKAGCITFLDVLSYFDFSKKKKLLVRLYDFLEPDGLLIIKDIDRNFSLKYLFAFFQEFLAVKVLGLTSADGLYFADKKSYLSLLKECKFITNVFDLSKGYLYPHILYVCHK
jgi:glycosyltransferase involved in cell wall biosynthesis